MREMQTVDRAEGSHDLDDQGGRVVFGGGGWGGVRAWEGKAV